MLPVSGLQKKPGLKADIAIEKMSLGWNAKRIKRNKCIDSAHRGEISQPKYRDRSKKKPTKNFVPI